MLGFAVVVPSVRHAEELLTHTERFVWPHPGVDVVETSRHWLDVEADTEG